MMAHKFDVGLIWAKIVNIWGQLGTVAGIVNTLMMIGVFYTTTLYPNFKVPLWLYIVVIAIGAGGVVWFIIKIGISGYYRFFSKQSEITEANRKIDLIIKYLEIEDGKKKK
jgi:ABC-type uncharacterized transport system permease subunit